LARLYREAPVNAIWEGSGNVMGLDVLRAFARDGDAAHATLSELAAECRHCPGADEAVALIERALAGDGREAQARIAVERLAQLAATAALQASAPNVADSFARTRLSGRRGATYGTSDIDNDGIALLLRRALPPSR
jgi:putative acyl-CoA dehydrogenase